MLSADEERRLWPLPKGEVAAAARIALASGVGRLEILRRRVPDLDTAARAVTFTRKGCKRKTLPPCDEARAESERPMRAAGPEGCLFRGRGGHGFTSDGSVFQRALRRTNVLDFTSHDLRHTFASRLAASGCDPFVIRDRPGHSPVTLTDGYVCTRAEEMRAAVNGLKGAEVSPSARKAG